MVVNRADASYLTSAPHEYDRPRHDAAHRYFRRPAAASLGEDFVITTPDGTLIS